MAARIAVLNSNDDVLELLRLLFEQRGHIVVTAHVEAIKRGTVDVEAFARQHRPEVVIYDIPPPYDSHWAFMEHMRSMPGLAGVPFVLTSTNSRRLAEIVGSDAQVLEIVGKPYDLEQIVRAVEAALGTRD